MLVAPSAPLSFPLCCVRQLLLQRLPIQKCPQSKWLSVMRVLSELVELEVLKRLINRNPNKSEAKNPVNDRLHSLLVVRLDDAS